MISLQIKAASFAAPVDGHLNKRREWFYRRWRRAGDVVLAEPQDLPEAEGHGDRQAEAGEGRRAGGAREGQGEEPDARLHPVAGRDEGEGADPLQDGAAEGRADRVQLGAHEDEHGAGAGADEDAGAGQRVEEIPGTMVAILALPEGQGPFDIAIPG